MNERKLEVPATRTQDEHSMSRRALIRAGWTIPVVLAMAPPPNVFANGSGSAGDDAGDDYPSQSNRKNKKNHVEEKAKKRQY